MLATEFLQQLGESSDTITKKFNEDEVIRTFSIVNDVLTINYDDEDVLLQYVYEKK